MHIRQANSKDYKSVSTLLQLAFKEEIHSDHKEHFLVERLRQSSTFVPELSLVAELDNQIIGYILLTKIQIITPLSEEVSSLALAPVAVHPSFQKKGVGGDLIQYAHNKAKELGFSSIVVLGHEDYYPRFGYRMAKTYGISFPFDVPAANCMAIELVDNALHNCNGLVVYPHEFME